MTARDIVCAYEAVPPPPRKACIAGVVVGPLIGIALGAGLLWLMLSRKRKNENVQQHQQPLPPTNEGYAQGGYYDPANTAEKQYSDVGINRTISPQPSDMVGNSSWQQSQQPAEVAGSSPSPAPPAELWHGNYRSP
jgi:hypothetical protein